MLLGLALLEGVAGLYFFLEDRYWPYVLTPGPIQNQDERSKFMARLRESRASGAASIVMQPDDETGWALQPSSVDEAIGLRVNSPGLRGGPIGPKQEGEVRLLFLGDSSVHGVLCPESHTMPVAAAETLQEQLGRPVVGINGGVPGFDSRKSLTQMHRLLPELKPDWVVIGNLWSDCYVQQGVQPGTGGSTRLVNRTNTYRLLKRLLEPILRSRRVGWFASEEEMRGVQIEDAQTEPEQYLLNLLEMANVARGYGATPIFLVLPAPVDLTMDGAPPLVLEYRALMKQAAAESRAMIVDGPSILGPSGVKLHHFLDQVHPGPELQRLLGMAVAHAVAKAVEEERPSEAPTG